MTDYGFTRHAWRKMAQLGLSVDDVLALIGRDDVIETYPDRRGRLLHGWRSGLELHIAVVGEPDGVTLVTTVYAVDRSLFPDGRTRRRRE